MATPGSQTPPPRSLSRPSRSLSRSKGNTRPSPWLVVVALLVTLLSLVPAWFCAWLVTIVTYGINSRSEPRVDAGVVLPLIGIALTLPLGPLVMSVGQHRTRWLWIALAVSLSGVTLASLATWVPVALGWR